MKDIKNTGRCEHTMHEENMEPFLQKFPTANKEGPYPILTVDPKYWWISDDPEVARPSVVWYTASVRT
jgi:hypothetical protein